MPPPHTVHLLYKQYYAFSDIVMPCVMLPTIHNNNTSPTMPKSESSISASNYLKSKKGSYFNNRKWLGYKRSDLQQSLILCKIWRKLLKVETNLFHHIGKKKKINYNQAVKEEIWAAGDVQPKSKRMTQPSFILEEEQMVDAKLLNRVTWWEKEGFK